MGPRLFRHGNSAFRNSLWERLVRVVFENPLKFTTSRDVNHVMRHGFAFTGVGSRDPQGFGQHLTGRNPVK